MEGKLSLIIGELSDDIVFIRANGLKTFYHPKRLCSYEVHESLTTKTLLEKYEGYGKIFTGETISGKIHIRVRGKVIFKQR